MITNTEIHSDDKTLERLLSREIKYTKQQRYPTSHIFCRQNFLKACAKVRNKQNTYRTYNLKERTPLRLAHSGDMIYKRLKIKNNEYQTIDQERNIFTHKSKRFLKRVQGEWTKLLRDSKPFAEHSVEQVSSSAIPNPIAKDQSIA